MTFAESYDWRQQGHCATLTINEILEKIKCRRGNSLKFENRIVAGFADEEPDFLKKKKNRLLLHKWIWLLTCQYILASCKTSAKNIYAFSKLPLLAPTRDPLLQPNKSISHLETLQGSEHNHKNQITMWNTFGNQIIVCNTFSNQIIICNTFVNQIIICNTFG